MADLGIIKDKKPKDVLILATSLIEIGSFNKARKLLNGLLSSDSNEEITKKTREKLAILKNEPVKYWAFIGTLLLMFSLYMYYRFIKDF